MIHLFRHSQKPVEYMRVGKKYFPIDNSESKFFIDRNDQNEICIMLEIHSCPGEYEGEVCEAYININAICTQAHAIKDFIGAKYIIETMNESLEREDSFYLFEHEPFLHYSLHIVEYKNDQMHIHLSGSAVIDGYAKPFIKAQIEAECWLTVII